MSTPASPAPVDSSRGSQPPESPSTAGATAPDHWSQGFCWGTLGWFALLHAGALLAPFFFSWQALATALVLVWLTGSMGICMGYHRLLTHRSFQTYPLVRRVLAVFGTLAGEGSPIAWVAAHRKHHKYADREGDPHSPREGAWWSHMLWMLSRSNDLSPEMTERFAKDLVKERFMRFLDATFLLWHLALALTLFLTGWLVWNLYVGVSMLVYATFLRTVFVMHVTWFVNSASHMWGYRNFETHDDSRNLWWVGLLAFGEGWHNNHHASPGRAPHGLRWWEFDPTYRTLCLMERLGLAWEVRHSRL